MDGDIRRCETCKGTGYRVLPSYQIAECDYCNGKGWITYGITGGDYNIRIEHIIAQ